MPQATSARHHGPRWLRSVAQWHRAHPSSLAPVTPPSTAAPSGAGLAAQPPANFPTCTQIGHKFDFSCFSPPPARMKVHMAGKRTILIVRDHVKHKITRSHYLTPENTRLTTRYKSTVYLHEYQALAIVPPRCHYQLYLTRVNLDFPTKNAYAYAVIDKSRETQKSPAGARRPQIVDNQGDWTLCR